MTSEQLIEYLRDKTTQMVTIAEKKNHDYNSGKDPFSNFQNVQLLNIASTEQGILVRMTDKLSRLSSFVKKDVMMVKDESIEDTCMDLANYALLFSAYVKSKKQGLSSPEKEHLDKLMSQVKEIGHLGPEAKDPHSL